jgi:hypothetical protein
MAHRSKRNIKKVCGGEIINVDKISLMKLIVMVEAVMRVQSFLRIPDVT